MSARVGNGGNVEMRRVVVAIVVRSRLRAKLKVVAQNCCPPWEEAVPEGSHGLKRYYFASWPLDALTQSNHVASKTHLRRPTGRNNTYHRSATYQLAPTSSRYVPLCSSFVSSEQLPVSNRVDFPSQQETTRYLQAIPILVYRLLYVGAPVALDVRVRI